MGVDMMSVEERMVYCTKEKRHVKIEAGASSVETSLCSYCHVAFGLYCTLLHVLLSSLCFH